MKPGILKRGAIALGRTERTPATPHATPACTKRARLVEDAGVARAVEITCSCGETTLVELVYPESERTEASS